MKKIIISFMGGGPNVDFEGDVNVMRHVPTGELTRIVVDLPGGSEDYPDQVTIIPKNIRWYRIKEVRS